jgi:hypothetical protein
LAKTAYASLKNKRARLPSEDEPIGFSRGKTFFGNPAIRATLVRGDRGPVALRPRISPGLPLSEATWLKYRAFQLSKATKNLGNIGSFNRQKPPGCCRTAFSLIASIWRKYLI